MQGDIYINDILIYDFFPSSLSPLFLSLSICCALLAVKLHSLIYFICGVSENSGVLWRGWREIFERVYERDWRGANGASDSQLRKPFHGDTKDKKRSCGNIQNNSHVVPNHKRRQRRWVMAKFVLGYWTVCEVMTAREGTVRGSDRLWPPAKNIFACHFDLPMPVTEIRHPVPHRYFDFLFYEPKCVMPAYTQACVFTSDQRPYCL